MKVGDICNQRCVTVTRDDRIAVAAQKMREHHVGSVVVVENRGARVVPIGMLTDRDIAVEVVAKVPEKCAEITVGDLDHDPLLTLDADALLLTSMEQMRREGVRRAPVVDGDGKILGVLSIDDVLELLAEQLRMIAGIVTEQRLDELERRP